MTKNTGVAESVMKAAIVTNPISVLIVPKLRILGNIAEMTGDVEIRCKGISTDDGGREFMISMLNSIIGHLQSDDDCDFGT
jgi:hypothetical protein